MIEIVKRPADAIVSAEHLGIAPCAVLRRKMRVQVVVAIEIMMVTMIGHRSVLTPQNRHDKAAEKSEDRMSRRR